MNLTDAEQKEREELLAEMRHPLDSVQDIEAVQAKALKWLRKHPVDEAILGEGEGLHMLKEAIKADN